tara:strand:- start:4931 stop:5647 length:717 start_codon:yes stop_codon:yes gene_type:complete
MFLKKIKKKDLGLLIIIFLLILIFIKENNIFKKIYFINSKNFEKRMNDVYGYCDKEYYGFIKMLKNKYKFVNNPKIIDYKIQPNPLWIIYDPSKKNDDKPSIFLNYKNKQNLFFKRKNDFFISDGNIQHTNNIISINFRVNAKFKINNIIKVYKLIDKNRVEIFQKKFNEEISNNKTIKLDFKTEKINSRWEKIYIEILELEKSKLNLIDQITLNLQNKFTFSDDQIIEKFNSCYYIK